MGNQTTRFLDSSTSSSSRCDRCCTIPPLDELTNDYLTTFHHVKMYMMSLKSQITPIATAVVDGIQTTLGRLNSTNTQTRMKEMATFTIPVTSPVPPTKGSKHERTLDLGVIEEDGEVDTDAELACDASDTSESPAATVTSNSSLPVKSFQPAHLPSGPVTIAGVIPDDEPTMVHLSTVAETQTEVEKVSDQPRGTVPPSSLDIAFMRLRMTRAPCISSMLNPSSDGARFLLPVERPRADKNVIFLQALGNYTFQQAVKAEEAATARREAMEQDEYNEQFLLAPPDDFDELLAEYINFDAMADDLAERQAKAYTMCDMDDDGYY